MNREQRQTIWFSLIVLLVGCTNTPIARPTSRVPVALNPPVPKTIIYSGQAVTPSTTNTFTVYWDNPNTPEIAKYCLTEFHSTTNILVPFTFKGYAPAGTNSWTFIKSSPQEFFTCRFAVTNVTPWYLTDWCRK